jgi:enterochelin esterase family protein
MRACSYLIPLTISVCGAFGQVPGMSPEIHPDRTVTFRLRWPKASEVAVYGDWMTGRPEALSKGSDGLWSVTSGPLDATGHTYYFIVDGVMMVDPANPNVKLRQQGSQSLLEVPASPAAPWSLTDVPHGAVVTEWRKSEILGRTERIFVYLPPGYHQSTALYPALYLMHGSGDVPDGWTVAGAANLILDNLIAAGKARPMLLVMPAGHAALPGPGPYINNAERFDRYLTREVMPFVESQYRVAPGSRNRGLAGLSMGGGLTMTTGFEHPDLFSALGIFSATAQADFETVYKATLDDPKFADPKLHMIWAGCGDRDPQCANMKQFVGLLAKHGIHATLRTIEGGAHHWPVWRLCLSEFAPLLFREKP